MDGGNPRLLQCTRKLELTFTTTSVCVCAPKNVVDVYILGMFGGYYACCMPLRDVKRSFYHLGSAKTSKTGSFIGMSVGLSQSAFEFVSKLGALNEISCQKPTDNKTGEFFQPQRLRHSHICTPINTAYMNGALEPLQSRDNCVYP